MCTVPRMEIPRVECEFYVDDCPCLGQPREMVEYWQPGARARMTTVRPVAEVERMSPALWSVIQGPYSAWRDVPLMIEHQPAWPASSASSIRSRIASA